MKLVRTETVLAKATYLIDIGTGCAVPGSNNTLSCTTSALLSHCVSVLVHLGTKILVWWMMMNLKNAQHSLNFSKLKAGRLPSQTGNKPY